MISTVTDAGQLADASGPAMSATGFSLAEREALYRDFSPLVRRLVGQYGDDPELRQDLHGEIYCRFCDLLNVYDPTRGVPLKAFLVRTLTASIYTYARRQWRQQRREVCLPGQEMTAMASYHEPAEPSWDDALTRQQFLQRLPGAIACLPGRQRQVLIWRYYEGRSYEEIATRLKVQVSTARSLVRHGHNSLRRFFSDVEMV
jgi:RNA polymerase sigma-70 factor (ECF subfamily)